MTTPLFITEEQVKSLFTMPIALEAVEEAFKSRAKGDAFNEPRRRLPTSSGAYNVMFATWRGHQIAGLKSYPGGSGWHQLSCHALRHLEQLAGSSDRGQPHGAGTYRCSVGRGD